MRNYHLKLRPGGIYHLLSRANGSEKLFLEEENYRFFLERLSKYILPIAEIYSYSLLPNHFHILAEIKKIDVLEKHFILKKPDKTFEIENAPDFIMERFSNFLNSYTKSFNKMYDRKGSLFMDYLRRIEIETERQLRATVFYIHKNPVHHGCCKAPLEWNWSSYHDFVEKQDSFVCQSRILKSFGGMTEFIKYHSRPMHKVWNRRIWKDIKSLKFES